MFALATRAALLTALITTSFAFSWGSPLVVSNTGTPCLATRTVYTTIQAAVNAASSGATIDVCPGTYPEQVLITIPLTLTGVRGPTADNALLTAPAGGVVANTTQSRGSTAYPTAAQVLVQNATGVTIENLSVDGSNSGLTDCNTGIVGIYYQNASGTVNNVQVQNQVGFTNCYSGFGVYVETDGSASSTVTIANSTVQFTSGINIGGTYPGTTVTIKSNSVVGSAVSMDNGIYVARGATGTVTGNSIINFASAPDTLGDVADATCGIAISVGTGNVTVSENSIGNAEVGICLYSTSDNNTVVNNRIFSSAINDGIYVCSSNNLVQNNVFASSSDAAIHIGTSGSNTCSAANNNTITNNTINGACVGIVEPSGTTGNVIAPNTFTNAGTVTSTGICQAAPRAAGTR